MAEEPENIVIQHLRFIRERVDTLHERQPEMIQGIGGPEAQVANMATQLASQSGRIDRLDVRLDRIERRLGLIEA